jgi:hypothetical protein
VYSFILFLILMKKVNVAFSLALLLATGYCSAAYATPHSNASTNAAPAVTVVATSYSTGVADGRAYAADLDAAYGKGSAEYEEALAAQEAIAVQRAKQAGYDPLYWRGYVAGLTEY